MLQLMVLSSMRISGVPVLGQAPAAELLCRATPACAEVDERRPSCLRRRWGVRDSAHVLPVLGSKSGRGAQLSLPAKTLT